MLGTVAGCQTHRCNAQHASLPAGPCVAVHAPACRKRPGSAAGSGFLCALLEMPDNHRLSKTAAMCKHSHTFGSMAGSFE
jgi:hypothetical protein